MDLAELGGSNCVVLFFRFWMILSKDVQTRLVVCVESLQLVVILLLNHVLSCTRYTANNAADDQWIENLHYHHRHGYNDCGNCIIPFEGEAYRVVSSWYPYVVVVGLVDVVVEGCRIVMLVLDHVLPSQVENQ